MSYYYIFTASIFFGLIFAYIYGRKTKQFKWSEYFVILILPFIGLILLIWQEGIKILWFYLTCCFIGNLGEHTLGYAFHKILGHRLWTYHRLTKGGYTSLMSWPFWGMAGILFLSLYKLIY